MAPSLDGIVHDTQPFTPTTDYHLEKIRRKSILIAACILLLIGVIVSAYTIVSAQHLEWNKRKLTSSQAIIAGTLELVGAIFVLLGLCFAIVMHRIHAHAHMGGALLPLSVFALVSVSYALTLLYSMVLNYSVESMFRFLPASLWTHNWFIVLIIQVPYWFSKVLSIVPLSALMLRLNILYYGTPWMPPRALDSRSLKCCVWGFVVAAFLPIIVCFVLDTIRMCTTVFGVRYNPFYDYFQFVYLLFLTAVDMVLALGLYLAKNDLKKYELDQTIILVSFSVLWWFHLFILALRKYTRVGFNVWPHFAYVAIMYLQVIVLFIFWHGSFRRMLRIRRVPRYYIAQPSATLVPETSKPSRVSLAWAKGTEHVRFMSFSHLLQGKQGESQTSQAHA